MTELELLRDSWKESGIVAVTLDSGKWGKMVQTKLQVGDGKPTYGWTSPVYHLFDFRGKRWSCSTDYRTVAAGIDTMKMRYDEAVRNGMCGTGENEL